MVELQTQFWPVADPVLAVHHDGFADPVPAVHRGGVADPVLAVHRGGVADPVTMSADPTSMSSEVCKSVQDP